MELIITEVALMFSLAVWVTTQTLTQRLSAVPSGITSTACSASDTTTTITAKSTICWNAPSSLSSRQSPASQNASLGRTMTVSCENSNTQKRYGLESFSNNTVLNFCYAQSNMMYRRICNAIMARVI